MKKRGGKEKTIQPIEHASMARDERSRVLHLGASLQHRFRKIPRALVPETREDDARRSRPASN